MNKTINTIHFNITEFCNYHCEYCYQGINKIQRIFDKHGYCKYSEEIEKLFEQEKCIDMPLDMIDSTQLCNVCGKALAGFLY